MVHDTRVGGDAERGKKMERPRGFEPLPGPWQGPVLPLYYGRINGTLTWANEAGQAPPATQWNLIPCVHRHGFTIALQWEGDGSHDVALDCGFRQASGLHPPIPQKRNRIIQLVRVKVPFSLRLLTKLGDSCSFHDGRFFLPFSEP